MANQNTRKEKSVNTEKLNRKKRDCNIKKTNYILLKVYDVQAYQSREAWSLKLQSNLCEKNWVISDLLMNMHFPKNIQVKLW